MRDAVIVSYARTGLAKAARGGFNITSSADMLGAAVEQAVKRSGVAPAEVEDVVGGQVAASGNVARAAALLAGLPGTTSGVTVNRACSSGATSRAYDPTAQRLVSYLVSTMPPGNVRVSTRFKLTQLSSAVKNGVPPPTRTG